MELKILQVNLNHTRGAQDLCIHNGRSWDIDIIVISEPYIKTADHNWKYDLDKTVLIIHNTFNDVELEILKLGHGSYALNIMTLF